MLEFIFVPVIFGIVTLGIYRIVELSVKRKERLLMIEKLGQSEEISEFLRNFPSPDNQKKSYNALKAALLLIGLGLGLLAAFVISSYWQSTIPFESRKAFQVRETINIIYGASVLFFGGLGLLLSFFLEQKYIQKEKRNMSQ
jgi:hypothetical protein